MPAQKRFLATYSKTAAKMFSENKKSFGVNATVKYGIKMDYCIACTQNDP